MLLLSGERAAGLGLNESPSEKEGKFPGSPEFYLIPRGLNESPSEKEGKFGLIPRWKVRYSRPQ